MKKLLIIVSVLIVLISLVTGCSSNSNTAASDPLINQAKIAWTRSKASAKLENYEVRHLYFDQKSILENGIGWDYKDYSWIPDSGDVFIFTNKSTWFAVFLDEQGEICKSYFYPEDAPSSSGKSTIDLNKSRAELKAELERSNAELEKAQFFLMLFLWQSYIGEPSYENTTGEWHSLTDKQIQSMNN